MTGSGVPGEGTARASATTQPAHVLIVEDNELASGALRVLFESTGRRVSVAATVADAIAACQADCPDLLLLDLTLPDGDGFLVLERTRRDGTRPRIVVAVTGHDDDAIDERCREMGCDDVLVKPVPARELLRRAQGWLDGA